MNTFNIAMLGGSGVGKTSLLTAMYDRFDHNVGQTNLQLTPDLEGNAILGECFAELRSMFECFEPVGQGIQGSSEERRFRFELGKRGKRPSFRLYFIDYPGGYLIDRPQKVLEFIKESPVIIIAIDTPALMEKQRVWNEKINKPSQIHGFFKQDDVMNLMQIHPRMVIFAPVKCETYVQDEKSRKALLGTIKEEYQLLLDSLKSFNAAVVITPVQT